MPTESTRDVFLAACAAISEPFSACGFRFAKSGPHTSKRSGEFRYRVEFASSSKNVAGVSIRMWISGQVCCPKLNAWRKTYSQLQPSDYVAGCQLQNLTRENISNDWNFASEVDRRSVIASAVHEVDRIVLPYFSHFDNLELMIETLQQRDISAMPINRVIEFLMCFAGRDAARNAGVQYLVRNQQFLRDYERDYSRYAERGIDYRSPNGHSGHLAFASHLFGLGQLGEYAA